MRKALATPVSEAPAVVAGARAGAPDGGGAAVPARATDGMISPAVPTSAEVIRKWRRAIGGCCVDMRILPGLLEGVRHASLGRGESKDMLRPVGQRRPCASSGAGSIELPWLSG